MLLLLTAATTLLQQLADKQSELADCINFPDCQMCGQYSTALLDSKCPRLEQCCWNVMSRRNY
jgi:hypothetical protein